MLLLEAQLFKAERYLSHQLRSRLHHDGENSLLHAGTKRQMRQIIKNFSKTSQVRKATVRIAVIDSDPLRFVGFRELLSSESDFDLQSIPLSEIGTSQEVDVVLIGSHPGESVIEVLTTVKALRPAGRYCDGI